MATFFDWGATIVVPFSMSARGGWPLISRGFALILSGQLAISLVAETRELVVVVMALLTALAFGGVGFTTLPSQTSGRLPRS